MRIFLCGAATALFFGLVFGVLAPERYLHLGDVVVYAAFISGAASQLIKQTKEESGGPENAGKQKSDGEVER